MIAYRAKVPGSWASLPPVLAGAERTGVVASGVGGRLFGLPVARPPRDANRPTAQHSRAGTTTERGTRNPRARTGTMPTTFDDNRLRKERALGPRLAVGRQFCFFVRACDGSGLPEVSAGFRRPIFGQNQLRTAWKAARTGEPKQCSFGPKAGAGVRSVVFVVAGVDRDGRPMGPPFPAAV